MDKQTSIRRIAQLSYSRNSYNPLNSSISYKKLGGGMVNAVVHATLCEICGLTNHHVTDCAKFISLIHNDKWDYV